MKSVIYVPYFLRHVFALFLMPFLHKCLIAVVAFFLTGLPIIANPMLSLPDSGSDGGDNGNVACLTIETWVYIEGATIDYSSLETHSIPMRTTLNINKLLPGQTYSSLLSETHYSPAGQPYRVAPWFYNGIEGDLFNSFGNPNPGSANYPETVVDWVLVSLRETPDGLPVYQAAALLHQDGWVDFPETSPVCCGIDTSLSYYIVIEHRNHLIVMSPEPIPIIMGTISHDFRVNDSYREFNPTIGIYLGYGQKEILPGIFAMFAGNGEQTGINPPNSEDTDINANDLSLWQSQNGNQGKYLAGDYDLNGDCNFTDCVTWERNNGRFSSVPRD